MLVQNSIGSCLQVKSSAQTGTQAAATAIPPWWVLGLPSGGRHNIILTRLEDDVTFSSHILTVVSPSVLPKHQPGVGRCPMYPLLLLVTDRKPSGHLDVIWSPRVTRLGHIDDSFYKVGKSVSHTLL